MESATLKPHQNNLGVNYKKKLTRKIFREQKGIEIKTSQMKLILNLKIYESKINVDVIV